MKKALYHIIVILLIYTLQPTPTTAQEWSFGGELGATLVSFFQYTPVHQEGGSYDRGYKIPHNEGWILNYYPADKKSFFSIAYTRFHPSNSDVIVRLESGRFSKQQIVSATFNHTISLNMGYQLDIGQPLSLNKEKLFFEPLYGIGLEWLQRYNSPNAIYKTGINPSLQAGFRLSYRHRRSKFSIKTLGNLGLRYHVETRHIASLPQGSVLTTTRSKSDFIAAQASYEYIFKSNKIEKKKREKKGERDVVNTFSRKKVQELKVGIHLHPFNFSRRISLNYESFPTKQNKSLFLDLTYFDFGYGLESNISEEENNPEYVFSIYKIPFLDVRLGRNIFSEKETGARWGVGYYLRSDIRLAKNRKYVEAFKESFGLRPNTASYYAALGANLQYKWLLKDRWSITTMLLTDLGIGSEDSHITKYPVFLEPLFFDVQARLYVGYRF